MRSQFGPGPLVNNDLLLSKLAPQIGSANWLRKRFWLCELAPRIILAPPIGSTNWLRKLAPPQYWLRELAPQIGWLRKSAPVLANNGGSYCCLRPGQPILSPAKPSRSEASFRMNKKGPHATTQGCQPAKPPEACFLTGMQLTTASTLANHPATLRSLGDPRLACSLERG